MKYNFDEYIKFTPLKDPLTTLAEQDKRIDHYINIITQELNAKYKGSKFTPYIVKKTWSIFLHCFYLALTTSATRPAGTITIYPTKRLTSKPHQSIYALPHTITVSRYNSDNSIMQVFYDRYNINRREAAASLN